jgi:phosphoribosylpyrophosphate synthetase
MGRCGILLLCHLLPETVRASLTDYFHSQCPNPYIVAVVAHEAETHTPLAHARVVYSPDHAGLAAVLRAKKVRDLGKHSLEQRQRRNEQHETEAAD